MEGIVFYWVAWSFWVMVTFFTNKSSNYRYKASFCILVLIILKPFDIMFMDFKINSAIIFLYLFTLFQVMMLNRRAVLYIFITSFIVMLAYDSFLLFELYDPVWVMFNRNWMIALLLVYLCVLLHSDRVHRFYTVLIGVAQGECLYSMILKKLNFSYPIGTDLFFDAVAAVLALLFLWILIESVLVMVEHHTSQQRRGRQKST
ncbi:MAG: hypothetical protein K0S25_1282 [Bacillus sp. (in: firmicutes)]|jgi:hypothetical protein|nr:hypothetical protein [Bacillus sp. (in: firmicutes)]